jgi:PAS domain S-box-containing protein
VGEKWLEDVLLYIGWSDADAENVRALAPHVVPHTRAIAEEFYARIRQHPIADNVFKDEAQVRRLQETLQVWVIEALQGPWDIAYYDRRCRIGRVHARIGLEQRYMFTAMNVVRLHLARIAKAAFLSEPERLVSILGSINKVLDLDLAIMMETFREALLDRIQRVEQLEREGIARQLAAAQTRYRDAIESAEVLVMVLDDTGALLSWNRKAAEVTGYQADELLGLRPLDVLVPDEESRAALLAARTDAPVQREATIVTRSGRERYLRWFVSGTVDPEAAAPVLYVLAVDWTDLRDAELRVRASERLAAVGTLAAGLAHEIRNPLNAAGLHVSVLDRTLRRLPNAPPAAIEATNVLRDEINRLSGLVTDFLDFARPRPMSFQIVDVAAAVAADIELVRHDADAAGVSLEYQRPTMELLAPLDAERFRQVMLNLVRNAIEAVAGTERRRVIVRVRPVRRAVEIDVEDAGGGIPPGAPIFDAFFTTKESGTGLGLAIVHRIVEGHGGTIVHRSTPGQTVFTMRLPAGPRE